MRHVVALYLVPCAITAILLQARDARGERFVAFGPIFSLSGHRDTPVWLGAGVESTYVAYDTNIDSGPGVGAFLHLEIVGFDHFRFGLGPQVNGSGFGSEVGLAYELGDEHGHASTLFLHIGPFASVGYAALSGRCDLPLGSVDGAGYGTGWGGALALKYVAEIRSGELERADAGIK